MPNTYTQIHIHAVFVVKYRAGMIQNEWKDKLYKYITGILQTHNHKLLIINGMPDHIHILIGMRPTQSLADLMQDIKGSSSKWINENRFTKSRFEWQQGYGAFSYSKSDLKKVILYIQNQKAHHTKKTFLEEYTGLLKEFSITYDDRFLFQEPE